jgi:hypothetical protein
MLVLMFSIQLNVKVVYHWVVDDNIHIEVHVLNFHKINTPVHHYQIHHRIYSIDSIIKMIEQCLCLIVVDIHEDFEQNKLMNKDDVID